MQLLSGIYAYHEGSIRIDGVELREISKNWLRRHVQIVLQEPFLFSKTIYENIHVASEKASHSDVHKAAIMASIHKDIEQFDEGYETMVGEKGVTLSGDRNNVLLLPAACWQKVPSSSSMIPFLLWIHKPIV